MKPSRTLLFALILLPALLPVTGDSSGLTARLLLMLD